MYNSSRRYRRMRRQHSGGAAVDYVMPFLILICVGVILILAFNLWRAIFAPQSKEAAYMHVVDGAVQLKVWGTENYFALDSDTLIMQGDALKTDANAKVIIEFFDGSIMRVDGASDLVFDSIDDGGKVPEINLSLDSGAVWFNKVYKNTLATEVNIDLDDIVVHSNLASVFEVDSDLAHTVRVLNVFENNEGVLVDILSEDKSSVVDFEKIGVAQEIAFTPAVLDRYWKFQSPTVLGGVADSFKSSEWYAWNIAEDELPTEIERTTGGTENVGLIPVESQVITEEKPLEKEPVEEVEPDQLADNAVEIEEEASPVVSGSLAMPTIGSVSGAQEKDSNGFYVASSNPAILTGSVSGAANVVVNGYTLSKFKAGDSTWTYYANADYGLLAEGENFYEIYALSADGAKSGVLTVKVVYRPPVVEEPVVESAPAEAAPEEAVVVEEESG